MRKYYLLKYFIIITFFLLAHQSYAQWTPCNKGLSDSAVNSIISFDRIIYAGTYNGGIFISSNNGEEWVAKNEGIVCLDISSIAATYDFICAGTFGTLIYISTNLGESWSVMNDGFGIIDGYINSIAIIKDSIFAATSFGLFKSFDKGKTWHHDSSLSKNHISSIKIDGNNIFAGSSNGVFKSTDFGDTWVRVSENIYNVSALYSNNNEMIIGTYGGDIFRSINSGLSWEKIYGEKKHATIRSILKTEKSIFFTSSTDLNNDPYYDINGGIFLTSNEGANWKEIGEGITNYPLGMTSLAVNDGYIFAGSLKNDNGMFNRKGNGIFRAKLGDFGITDVNSQKYNYYYDLHCNPNPAENIVNLDFSVSKYCPVTLTISNSLGIKIADVINQKYYSEGTYHQAFDTSTLPSGIYFCTMQTPECTITKQFVVVR